MLSHRLDAGDVSAEIGPPDLHLDGAKSLAQIVVGLLQQRLDREVEIDAAGVAGHAGIEAAEQAPQRQFCALGFQVPQRDVERGQCQHHRSAAPAIVQAPPDMMPDCFGVVGLAALNQCAHFAAEDICHRAADAADGVGVSDPFCAVGIADAAGDQLEGRDLAMGAVGQNDGEGNAKEARLDALDASHGAPPCLISACFAYSACFAKAG
jgi:hypothetical protein